MFEEGVNICERCFVSLYVEVFYNSFLKDLLIKLEVCWVLSRYRLYVLVFIFGNGEVDVCVWLVFFYCNSVWKWFCCNFYC